MSYCRGVSGHIDTSITQLRCTGRHTTACLLICPWCLVCGRPLIACIHLRRTTRSVAISALCYGVPGQQWWHGHAQQPACCHPLSSLPTLAEERHLLGKHSETDGGTDGEMDGEITVERDGNRRTGASHTMTTTISNNNNDNVCSIDINNNDSSNNNYNHIITTIPYRQQGRRQWHGRQTAAFERS